jgi:hypothetical protein
MELRALIAVCSEQFLTKVVTLFLNHFAPSLLVGTDRRFTGDFCLHLQGDE